MPGAYAHLTLANIVSAPDLLDQTRLSQDAKIAVLDYKKFVELGAVSPDLPYLRVSGSAKRWADIMHYTRPESVIKCGVRIIAAENNQEIRNKKLAWLLGYASHVGGDTTIHPVVELKVGPYEDNAQAHRVCEMNQDAYIFQRLNVGEIGLGEFLDSGVGACRNNNDGLDTDIIELWNAILNECYAEEYARNPPEINQWFKCFVNVVDLIEEGGRLIPLARHVAIDRGLTYPLVSEIDYNYIENLNIPSNETAHYDEVFNLATDNVLRMWEYICDYIFNGNNTSLDRILRLNLDTGKDANGVIQMWRMQ